LKLSYTLSRNTDGTWRVEIPFNGRTSVHQTRTKDRAVAEERARFRLKRLPIEDRAHKKFRDKRRKKKPTVAAAAPPPAPPAIDPAATAAKLRALPVSTVAGAVEPAPHTDPPLPAPATENEPAPASTGEAPPAPALPELPEAAPTDEPIHPEIGDDRKPDDGEREGQEFFADVAANAIVVGTVKMCVEAAAQRGKVANTPSEKGLEWYTEGLQYRLRKLIGDASMGPNAKLFVGAGAVVLSMLWGCADAPGAAAAASRSSAAAAPRTTTHQSEPPAPAAKAPGDRYAGADQGGGELVDELALVKQQQEAPRNGQHSAAGRFR
jgi:hypothetical protein